MRCSAVTSSSPAEDVHSALRGHSPGDSLDVVIVRDRQESTVRVALGGVPGAQVPRTAPAYGMYGHGYSGRDSHGHHGMTPKHGCSMGKMYRPPAMLAAAVRPAGLMYSVCMGCRSIFGEAGKLIGGKSCMTRHAGPQHLCKIEGLQFAVLCFCHMSQFPSHGVKTTVE